MLTGPRTAFDEDLRQAERSVPFGVITQVSPFRWAFRVGVHRLRGENYNDATSRVLMGRRGVCSHPDSGPTRLHRCTKTGWIGVAGNDAKVLEAIYEHIRDQTMGELVPPAVALAMLFRGH